MDAPGGNRRGPVTAFAPRSAALADEEHRLSRLAVVAVVVGSFPVVPLFDLKGALAHRFRIDMAALEVTVHAPGEFLIDPALCLLDGVVCVSRCERIVCQNLCSIAAVVCKTGCSVGDTGCRAGCSKQQVDCLADNCPT